MRRPTVLRTAVAVSSLSMVLLVSACGSDKPAAKDEPKGEAATSAPATPAAKALSQPELDRLLLVEGEMKDHKIVPPTKADLASTETVSSDKPECEPLVDGLALRSTGKPGATATAKIVAVPKAPAADATDEEKLAAGLDALSATITSDTLGSYEGQGAADGFAALKKAGEDCAGGFTFIAGTDKTKITKVEPASYTAGDEALAFTLTTDVDGEAGTSYLVAVRKGRTLATFYSVSLADTAEQPKAVIDAQVKKLG